MKQQTAMRWATWSAYPVMLTASFIDPGHWWAFLGMQLAYNVGLMVVSLIVSRCDG